MKTLDLNQFSVSQKRFRTDYLFPRPSFFRGLGSVVDIFGSKLIHVSFEIDKEADFAAIRNDFRMVGQDISDSIEICKKETEGHSFKK